MTHRSPLVTLIGLVAAFAIMFGVNLASSAPRDSYAGGASPSAAASTPAWPHRRSRPPPPPPRPRRRPRRPRPPHAEDESEFPNKIVYAGYTDDDSTAIAVAILGTRAAAYLCDGDQVEAWLRGTVDGDEITPDRQERRRRSRPSWTATRSRAPSRSNDEKLDFAIREAKRPAGLYRAKGSKTTIGWIVLPNGSQVGIQTTGEESSPGTGARPRQPRGDRRRRATGRAKRSAVTSMCDQGDVR